MTKNYKLIKIFKKWFVLISLLIIFFILQNSVGFTIFKIKPLFIFPFAISNAMFSDSKIATTFGLICGFFMDCFSCRLFGTCALFFLIVCTFVSLISKNYVKYKFINFILFMIISILLFESINFIALYVCLNFKNIWYIWISHIIPISGATLLVSPLHYLISKQIYNSFDRKKLVPVVDSTEVEDF